MNSFPIIQRFPKSSTPLPIYKRKPPVHPTPPPKTTSSHTATQPKPIHSLSPTQSSPSPESLPPKPKHSTTKRKPTSKAKTK